jgi:hypothetical protein
VTGLNRALASSVNVKSGGKWFKIHKSSNSLSAALFFSFSWWSVCSKRGEIMTITAPTCEELWDEEGFKSVSRIADDSWRHGCYVKEVFLRESDNTYWQASYRRSGDGETNELGEGHATIIQVEPVEVKTIAYKAVAKG